MDREREKDGGREKREREWERGRERNMYVEKISER
jgi:hypothetical protein